MNILINGNLVSILMHIFLDSFFQRDENKHKVKYLTNKKHKKGNKSI